MVQELQKEIAGIATRVKELLAKLYEAIENLPDNPNINRVSSNIYTMQFSELQRGKSWLPEHYDFKHQYREVIKAMQKSQQPLTRFENIIEAGEIVYNAGSGWNSTHRVRLHPDVITHLKALL